MLSNQTQIRFKRIESFLMKEEFNGFTKRDLFIMNFIKKGWGQDIASLSNMAEMLVNCSFKYSDSIEKYRMLMKQVVRRAIHPKVNPYKKKITDVKKFGKYNYYLEHLNIILGSYRVIADDDKCVILNERISEHLYESSMMYDNFHADLLPHVKMKWSADQAAIIYSLWLFDKNNDTAISADLQKKWLEYMESEATHEKTGLYICEVLGTRRYSNQPRGCALSYMIHYMSKFNNKKAKRQWSLYKKYMMRDYFICSTFREYLPEFNHRMTPDSGPILFGNGVAATGLGLNAASSMEDWNTYKKILKLMNIFGYPFNGILKFVGPNIVTGIGTDLLSTSIWLNAETKISWY